MTLDFDLEVSRIMERFVPMVQVRRGGGGGAWFDGDLLIIVGVRTVLLRIGIYSAKLEVRLIDSMRLRRLVTLQITVRIFMIVPLQMPGGVRYKLETHSLIRTINNKQFLNIK